MSLSNSLDFLHPSLSNLFLFRSCSLPSYKTVYSMDESCRAFSHTFLHFSLFLLFLFILLCFFIPDFLFSGILLAANILSFCPFLIFYLYFHMPWLPWWWFLSASFAVIWMWRFHHLKGCEPPHRNVPEGLLLTELILVSAQVLPFSSSSSFLASCSEAPSRGWIELWVMPTAPSFLSAGFLSVLISLWVTWSKQMPI